MFNFNYYNPTHIVFGKDRLSELDRLVPADARVLITYGGGSAVRSGLIDRVKKALGDRTVLEFAGIEPNPRYETLSRAAEVVRSNQINFLLAVGGGSVIDGTKFISLAANYSGNSLDLLKFGFAMVPRTSVSSATSIGTVLTLPATGSEMNCGAVISEGHGKYPVMCDLTFPKFSLLDPTLTYTLPKIQVANGIIDAFVHTTEQYLTFPVDARIQDRIAEGILQTLIEIGADSVNKREDYNVRANHVWAATMALNGVVGAGVPQDWATHMIGHELTALFGIDHGQTLAIIHPALLEIRREKKKEKLLQYAERVWNIQLGSEEERVSKAIQNTRSFFESLGVKTYLSQYGVDKSRIMDIVAQLREHGMIALSETQDQDLDVTRQILEAAY